MGFQTSPKPLAGTLRREISLSLVTGREIGSVFELLTTAAGLSSWLGATAKCQPDVGAKFSSDFEGESSENVFIAISVPGNVVILSETFGEISVKLRKTSGQISVSVRINRATSDDELEGFTALAKSLLARFEGAVLDA